MNPAWVDLSLYQCSHKASFLEYLMEDEAPGSHPAALAVGLWRQGQ